MEDRASTKGVLRTPQGQFAFLRHDPSPALAPYATWLWTVAFDLPEPHDQITLPHPAANLVVEGGTATVWGPMRSRWRRTLRGAGRAVAVRFRPGGIRPLLDGPVSAIADRTFAADALRGVDGGALVAAVEAHADAADAAAALDAALAPALPAEPDPAIALATRAVELLAEDRSLRRVGDLAERMALSVRSVQRLFAGHVGIGPAHVIRRYRLQEAAAAATEGGEVDWARLAVDLGYYDQAHLVRDFTAQIGTPPARYAAGSG